MAKIGSFIGSIVLFIASTILSLLTYTLSDNLANITGAAALSLIAIVPLLIIFFMLLIVTLISGTITAIRTLQSDVKAIRIISIVLIVLYVALIVFNAIFAIKVFGNL